MGQEELIRLLLVEDDPLAADLAYRFLNKKGEQKYQITRTDRLAEAQKYLNATRYALVLLDLNIIDSRGLATLDGIRAVAQDVPIVILTAEADVQLVRTALSQGVQDYLIKGELTPNNLTRAVTYALERKQAEIRIHASETLFRTAFEGAAIGMALVDQGGRWIQTNRAVQEMLGYSADEFKQMTVSQFTHPDDQPASREVFRKLIEGEGNRYRVEKRYLHKNGSTVWARVVVSTVYVNELEPSVIVAMLEDITQHKKAEEALAAERNLLRTLIDNLPDRIYVKDTQGRYIIKNRVDATLMGASSTDEVVGKTDFDYYPVELAQRYSDDDQTVIQSGQPLINREEPIIDAAGNQRWILTSKVPLQDSQGKIIGLVGVGRDISERRRMEEAEREQRVFAEALRDTTAAMNSTLDFDKVLDRILDNIGRTVPYGTANISLIEGDTARIVRCCGYTDPVLEASMKATVWPIPAMPHLRHLIETGQAFAVADLATYLGWDDQMSIPWIRSWTAAPICLDGAILGLINLDSDKEGFFNDLHVERLQAFADQAAIALKNARLYSEIENHAAELRERVVQRTADLNRARDRVEAILNSSTDAIILAHTDGEIRQTNLAFDRLFGYEADETFGLSLTAFFDAAWHGTVSTTLQDVAADGQIRRFEAVARRKDGSIFNVEVGLSPVQMDSSQNGAMVCNVRDITDRKRTEQTLRETLQKERELSELKSRFISVASHEFRTPLAIILSAVESVKNYRQRMDDSQIEGRLCKVEYQIEHMIALLDDVLTVSRAQSRKVEFNPHSLDLDSICRSLIEDFRNASPMTHTLRLVSDGENDEPLLADEKLFRQIITNLISNAIKYSPPGSEVQVALHRGSSGVTLQVTDHGIGIPEEDLHHLFQPFHRATNIGTIPGTGLGLTIVKHAAELHGGTVSVDSQVGMGSTFTVSIPVRKNGG